MATKLDLADAQFLGFAIGRREGRILHLVESMGLSKKEWEQWKVKYPNTYLKESEIEEIEEFFSKS